jgi:uncharacterized OsmC-like protein
MVASRVAVRELQRPLRERYQREGDAARVTLRVGCGETDLADPLHCEVRPEAQSDVTWRSGAHPAVGGTGDVPCSGDLLIAALAACQETTLRMVAASMGIELEKIDVDVEADWDPRGTLGFTGVPVGITKIRCSTRVTVRGDARGERAERLLRSAEKYCVVLDTLRTGVPVESSFELVSASASSERA